MSPFFAGCSGEQPGPQGETVGTFSAALVTQGGDGATYQFPTGTMINLRRSDNSFNDFFALDNPNETLISRRVPAGSYTASLTYNGVEGAYILQKTQNNMVSIVPATLLNPTPIQFDVAAGGTTSLALSFRVQGLGDITFSVGNVNITLNTSEQVNATGSRVNYVVGSTIQQANVDPSLSMEAQTLLAVTPGENFSVSLGFQLTGTWQFTLPNIICANGTVAELNPSGSSGFAARMSTMVGAGGRICVADTGGNDQVSISATADTTPPDLASALPGSYAFTLFVDGFGGDVFNGTTFQQSLFEGPRQHGFGSFVHRVMDQSTITSVAAIENFSNLNPTFMILP
jgi:hypothetical protein